MPRDPHNFDPLVESSGLRAHRRCDLVSRHRNPLAGDGPSILDARRADIAAFDAEMVGDRIDETSAVDVPFFDPEIDVLSLATRLVGRDLVDSKIVDTHFDSAPDLRGIVADTGSIDGNRRPTPRFILTSIFHWQLPLLSGPR